MVDRDRSLAVRTADRALAPRRAAYAAEIRQLIDAAVAVMRASGSIDPKVSDIVKEAGLSNQAFYRHFRSKDELLLAVLDDGRERLVAYLDHTMRREADPVRRVRRWIEGIMAQARNAEAAEATRPFALNGPKLAHQFPEESERSMSALKAPLIEAIAELKVSDAPEADPARDADAIYHLVMGRMHRHLTERTTPTKADIDHLVTFSVSALLRPEAESSRPPRS